MLKSLSLILSILSARIATALITNIYKKIIHETPFYVSHPLLCAGSLTVVAQLLQPGNVWSQSSTTAGVFAPSNTTTAWLRADIDTTLSGIDYKLVEQADDSLGLEWERTSTYLREADGVVYLRDFSGQYAMSSEEHVLYDYNLAVGDTFTLSDNCLMVVATVDSVQMLDGSKRKRVSMEPDNEWSQSWIEGVGSTWVLIPFQEMMTCWIDGNSTTLRCFTHNEALTYQNGDCYTYIVSNENVRARIDITLAPNPATTTLQLTTDHDILPASITILDATGRQMQQSILELPAETLDISSLPTGVYFLRLQTRDKAVWSERFVKR